MGKVYNYIFSYDRRYEFSGGDVNKPVWLMDWKDLNPNKLYKCNFSIYSRHSIGISTGVIYQFSVPEWNILNFQASSTSSYPSSSIIGCCTYDNRLTGSTTAPKCFRIDFEDCPPFCMYAPTTPRVTLSFNGAGIGASNPNFLIFSLRMEEIEE